MNAPTPPKPASGGAGASPVALDAVALGRLRELDPDGRHGVLRRVFSAFETSLVRMLVQLNAERENGNPGVVSSVAHTLKSSSASVGALQLSAACAEVERRLREQQPGDLQADVEKLLKEGESALVSVRAMLQA